MREKMIIAAPFEHFYPFLINLFTFFADLTFGIKAYFAVAKRLLAYENDTLSSYLRSNDMHAVMPAIKCAEL
jgi:hypothetical protein